MENKEIDIQSFYPEELVVRRIEETDTAIYIRLKSKSTSCECPRCHKMTAKKRATYERPVSRMTERCSEFIIRLALGTSCEGASRILAAMGIKYSGDSISRLLLKRLETMPAIDAVECA